MCKIVVMLINCNINLTCSYNQLLCKSIILHKSLFLFSFSDVFQFTLIKIALNSPPSIITQTLNEEWSVPKNLNEDVTAFVKDLANKYKRFPIKKPKGKKAKKGKKEKKSKREKKSKDKSSKKKSPKLTKEEKRALKLQKKLLQKQLREEEERKLLELMNKLFLRPLNDIETEDEFFKSKFKNFKKRMNLKKGKGKKGKKKR